MTNNPITNNFFTDLSEQVQIIILTCHTDRYREIGKVVGITEPERSRI